jgi:hypothetical protein
MVSFFFFFEPGVSFFYAARWRDLKSHNQMRETMQSSTKNAYQPNQQQRSDVPAPPSTLPPRAPWLTDLCSSVCLKCSEEFGVFRRRHHCRACGGLFCDSCSEKRVKGVPGYGLTKRERVCDICFYNDIAIAVVWNERYSGWHMKYFDNFAEANSCYSAIPQYASRVMLKVGSGLVHQSYFCRNSWKQRVMDYAGMQIRIVLPARIPLLWHNDSDSSGRSGDAMSTEVIRGTVLCSQHHQWPPSETPNVVPPIPDPPRQWEPAVPPADPPADPLARPIANLLLLVISPPLFFFSVLFGS